MFIFPPRQKTPSAYGFFTNVNCYSPSKMIYPVVIPNQKLELKRSIFANFYGTEFKYYPT